MNTYKQGDKGFHFLLIEICAALNGGRCFALRICNGISLSIVSFFFLTSPTSGSNNDQGLFSMATKGEIEELGVKGVSDQGIKHYLITGPKNSPVDWERGSQQGS